MATVASRLLTVLPLNPIALRIVHGGSRRTRHLLVRSGYLAVMVLILLIALLGSGSTMRELAQRGASAFSIVSYGQVFLICILAPVFMGGAIAQESNPQTWDVLLTSPLSSLQIVLGNLFGRLFFVFALLISTFPLFAVTQLFGGVPGSAIIESYAIAAASALLMGSIAITLSATRSGGRRAVFVFYTSILIYLFATWAVDQALRAPVAVGSLAVHTTAMTPLNPFLALTVLLQPSAYTPYDSAELSGWVWSRVWYCSPVATQLVGFTLLSLVFVTYSTLRVRLLGAALVGGESRERVASGRVPNSVSHNPIAWREVHLRGQTPMMRAARWVFVAAALSAGLLILLLTRAGTLSLSGSRVALTALLAAEVMIVVLAALNMSASAVSREREDKSLDILLTTPIQPGAYITGKLRGLVQYLMPLIAVPSITLGLAAVFVLTRGFWSGASMMVSQSVGTNTVQVPYVLPETAIALPLVLTSFTALCVMIGLDWSVRSKGSIGSVVAATGVVLAVAIPLGLCGVGMGGVPYVGAFLNAAVPINLVLAAMDPGMIEGSLDSVTGRRLALILGAIGASLAYCLAVYGLHANIKANFMMRVRRLSGTA